MFFQYYYFHIKQFYTSFYFHRKEINYSNKTIYFNNITFYGVKIREAENKNLFKTTVNLVNEYDASTIVKQIGTILGGKGGGGRKDFAQASGGSDNSKIDFSFEEILKKIN